MSKHSTISFLSPLRWCPFLMVMLPVISFGKTHGHNHDHPTGGAIEFTENKNQWNESVRFATDLVGARVFLQQHGITFALYDAARADELQHQKDKANENELVNAHAYQVKFLNANAQAQVAGSKQTAGVKNYFLGNDPAKWASNVASYQVVEYRNLYPKTDLHLFEQAGRLKYEYILQPGADPSVIKMKYTGLNGISISNGELHLKTSLNTVVEQKPYVYQVRHGKKVEVAARFVLKNDVVSFAFPNGYDTALPLVIDPVMVFSTYSGSSGNNYGYTAAFDDLGFVYSGGVVFAPGFPTSPGAYQISYAGNTDMGLIKYDPNVTVGAQARVFATYIGGTGGADHPHSLVTNQNREMLIYGSSGSANFPTTANAYDQQHNGGIDVVVCRLSSDGTQLLASTYLGGPSSDGQTSSALNQNYGDAYRGDITVDTLNNVYFTATTNSDTFPVVNGFQSTKGNGYDAFICKMNSDLSSIIWSSFFGGDDDDGAYSVQIGSTFEVYIGGGTRSTDLPGTVGAPFPVHEGGTDGFAAKISADGTTLIRATYAGTTEYDQAYFLQLDPFGAVYLFGQTLGNYPTTPGRYVNPNSGQFIHKFNSELTVSVFSTVVGNGNNAMNISPTAFLVDECGQILLSGFGGGFGPADISNMPLTPDAYQSTQGGFYIMQLGPNADSLKYATYISTLGAHVDGGTSRFDKKGNIYQSSCVSGGWPITPNAWSATNQSAYNNGTLKMAITELDPDFNATLDPNSTVNVTEGCAPLTLHFERVSNSGDNYWWHFGDGTDTLAMGPVTHTFTLPGVYTVTHYLFDSTTCQGSAHASRTITVHGATGTAGPDKAMCNATSVELTASGGVTYLWEPSPFLSATNIPNPVANPTTSTNFAVTVTDANGCVRTDTVLVSVDALPNLANPGPQAICQGDSVSLSLSTNPDYTYAWSPAIGLSSTSQGTVTANPSATTTYTVDVSYDGCSVTENITVEVTPIPSVGLPNAFTICPGQSVEITATGADTFAWAASASLSDTTGAVVTASPLTTTTYTVTGTSGPGCSNTASVTVTVQPLQAAAANSGPYCAADSIQLSVTPVTNATYAWTGPNGFTSTAQNPVLPNAATGMEGTYSVQISVVGCNSISASTTVALNPSPALNVSAAETICEGESVMLSASGADTYSWSPAMGLPGSTGPTIQASPVANTTYTVSGTNQFGCSTAQTIEVTVTPAVILSVNDDTEICPGTATTLVATSPNATAYLWTPVGGLDDPYAANPTATPAGTTQYVVSASANGCTSYDTVVVTVSEPVNLAVSADYYTGPAPHAVQFTNNSTGATGFSWNFGDDSPLSTEVSPAHTYTAQGTYMVVLTASYGINCSVSDTLSIQVVPNLQPNIFTPNGDGVNDEFQILMTKKPFDLRVMNRWGTEVAEKKNYHLNQNWKAEGVPDGLYFYQVTTNDGEIFKGWVEILR